jgi:subtilisin family serine protease
MKRVTATLAGLLILASAMPAVASAPQPPRALLSKHDRSLLAEAGAQGRPEVTMLLATAPGANDRLELSLGGLGARVGFRDDELGYIRATVPIKQAEAAAKLKGINAVSLDEIVPMVLPPQDTAEQPEAVPPPGADTPAVNPYMPTRDIGAPQFVAEHPTFDGRGVVIGILDTGIDLLTPELQNAMLLNGTPAPKIMDWVTATSPLEDDDPTWVSMSTQVRGRSFTVNGLTYQAPGTGFYRFGLFDERDPRLGGEIDNDVNRDGNPSGSSGLFAILWDTQRNRIWVDTNQNQDFTDERAMTDFKVNRDYGVFGVDDPSTAVRESMPFVVQTDWKDQMVNIGIVAGAHGTHVAGIAAGNGFFGGAFNGAAPGARIVSARACMFTSGCTSHALIEGMIYLAKDAHVDVINMSIGGLPALNDGNNARAVIYDRLIDRYKVQMFISAGNNGPGLNTVGDPSVASRVISVGAYVQKDTLLYDYGNEAVKEDGLFTFSSRGPREDGGFKPNIVAPGAAISSVPAWQEGQPVAGTYDLPPGYAMFNGTSMAAPEATGGAALLISAARQSGVWTFPETLRTVITSTARFLDGYGAHEQGTGLMNVPAAWEMLRHVRKLQTVESSAPVNTVLSGYLATPGQGPGIYDREGWEPGQSGTRTITLTRRTGGSRPVPFQLTWVGNDGTFTSAPSIDLPLNTPTALDVMVAPIGTGVHSAILQVDDPETIGIDYMVLNTVVAASHLTAVNDFAVGVSGLADRADSRSYFFYVPDSTPAAQVQMAVSAGRARISAFHPYGVPVAIGGYTSAPATATMMITGPAPGVWEITVETSRASDAPQADYMLSTALLGVDAAPSAWTIDPAAVGTAYQQNFSFTNRFGAFSGGAAGTTLGSAAAARPTIDTSAAQIYDIHVAPGSTALTVKIGNPTDTGSDLDLYLYNCTSGSCHLAGASTSGSAEEQVALANPAAGLWKALVDPYAIPSGATQYDYLDVFTNPAFGHVTVTDSATARAHGAAWTAPASVQANAAPDPGRFLQGFVQVRSGSAVLGSVEMRMNIQ